MEDLLRNYSETWKGEHRGVSYRVVHWRLGWNYYIDIPVDQLPDTTKPLFNLRSKTYKLSPDGNEHIHHDHTSAPIISDLDWHGGITLYEKARDGRGKATGYSLGCDYMHLDDEGKVYSLDHVAMDARHSIDRLWELVPNLRLRCAWNGRFYNADEIYYTADGVCVALENIYRWERRM